MSSHNARMTTCPAGPVSSVYLLLSAPTQAVVTGPGSPQCQLSRERVCDHQLSVESESVCDYTRVNIRHNGWSGESDSRPESRPRPPRGHEVHDWPGLGPGSDGGLQDPAPAPHSLQPRVRGPGAQPHHPPAEGSQQERRQVTIIHQNKSNVFNLMLQEPLSSW